MAYLDPLLPAHIEQMRRVGSTQVQVAELPIAVDVWRKEARKVAHEAGLRIRTYVAHGWVFVWWPDYEVTHADLAAAGEALGDFLAGKPAQPFEERVRRQIRKRIGLVPPIEAQDGAVDPDN